MFGLETLDILIGLVTIYLAFAVACTACVEAFSAFLQLRSKNLEFALSELLEGDLTPGKPFITAFYEHPLVKTLSRSGNKGPSYIPPEIVGKVVVSLVIAKTGAKTLDDAVKALPAGGAKDLLQILLEEAKGGAGDFRKLVEVQFDATMDRASGWFKRKTQLVTLCVSVVLVASLNVDTVAITTSLASNPETRAALVEIAEQKLQKAEQAESNAGAKGVGEQTAPDLLANKSAEARAAVVSAQNALNAAALPLGWSNWALPDGKSDAYAHATAYLTKVFGLLLSIFAISLGAPFWFNVLDRFNAVRTTGVRQSPGQQAASGQTRSDGASQPPATS